MKTFGRFLIEGHREKIIDTIQAAANAIGKNEEGIAATHLLSRALDHAQAIIHKYKKNKKPQINFQVSKK